MAAAEEVSLLAVGPDDAGLELVGPAFQDGLADHGLDALAVVRVHQVEEGLVREPHVCRHPEEAMKLVGPADMVVRDVPFPASDVRDRLRLREPLAGLAQGLLLALPAGDV